MVGPPVAVAVRNVAQRDLIAAHHAHIAAGSGNVAHATCLNRRTGGVAALA